MEKEKRFKMILAGNWKMKMGFQQAQDFFTHFKKLVGEKGDLENFLFFPPASLSLLFQKEAFYWGGQNVYHQLEGAFTGETSARVLKEMGAGFCLIGHSERRWVFGESEVDIEKKFHLLQELGLIPVLCVGEAQSDRSNKKKVLGQQLSWIKNYTKYEKLPWKPELLPPAFKEIPFIIAYEPVWSIGTGDLPSIEEIEETARWIKDCLSAFQFPVFYGGSVDKDSAKDFSDSSSLDGLLVGGASLDPDHFYAIYQKVKGL